MISETWRPERVDVIFLAALADELQPVVSWLRRGEHYRTFSDARFLLHYAEIVAGAVRLRVMACVQPEMGQRSTASAVTRLAAYKPRLLMMTGICAGNKAKGLRQGDIVVATQTFDADAGKRTATEIQPSIVAANLPAWLRSGWLDLPHTANTWHERISIRHPDGRVPAVFHGTIATTGQVIEARNPFAQLQQRARDVIALDMEVLAFYRAAEESDVTALAAKGVTDFAQPGKNDRYRAYAAEASFRWAVAFLELVAGELQSSWSRNETAVELGSLPPSRPAAPGAALEQVHQPVLRAPRTSPSSASQPSPYPLFGREQLLREIADRLNSGVRLITLVGPGGIGKTRLSQELAARLEARYRAGSRFVSLASVTSSDLLVPALARALGIEGASDSSTIEQIGAALADTEQLIVLDNLEEVVAEGSKIAERLTVATKITLIVTSRIPLQVRHQQLIEVPPLPTPELGAKISPEELQNNPSVALFVECAQARESTFVLDKATAPWVAAICRWLDGIPLAIELVAAQSVGTRTLKEIYQRLPQLALDATDDALDRPTRHQSMSTAIAWSVENLAAAERRVFEQLSLFVGDFSLQAVIAVCGDLSEAEADNALNKLLKVRLLQRHKNEGGVHRFSMFSVIRLFAAQRFAQRTDTQLYRAYFGSYFLQLAEQSEPLLEGPEQHEQQELLECEHANIQQALGLLLECGKPREALRLVAALWRFWYNRGYLREGHTLIGQVLERQGLTLIGQALDAATENENDDLALRARALDGLGSILRKQGDFEAAQRSYEEALALYRALHMQDEVAQILYRVGSAAMYADKPEQAASYLQESLQCNELLGDQQGIARARNNLGVLCYYAEDYATAKQHYEAGLVAVRLHGDEFSTAIALGNLGEIAFLQGDPALALARYKEGLTISHRLEDPEGIAYSLEWLALLLAERGERLRAARLWAAAESIRTKHGLPLAPQDEAAKQARILAARGRCDPAAWEAAWAAGTTLSTDDVVAEALAT